MATPRPVPRLARVFGAINAGSFRVSAMVVGVTEAGDLIVLGSGHRQSQGIRRGYVTDMRAATYAIRDCVERAEKAAGQGVHDVVLGCTGAGLESRVAQVEIEIGGRRIEEEDVEQLLVAARDGLHPDGRLVLHAQPAQYVLDGAHGVQRPHGLHAERLAVDIHVMLADRSPLRNLTEAVQGAHLDVEALVAAPVATARACLTDEERELGTALVEIGAEVTHVSFHRGGMPVGLASLPYGSADITDAIASAFGIRRFQAERLKCVAGSAVASPSDHAELLPLAPPEPDDQGDRDDAAMRAEEKTRVPRAQLVSVITGEIGRLTDEIARALKAMERGPSGSRGAGAQCVLTGGGAELAGIAEFVQGALGRPARVGRPVALPGLPEAHTTPGFATLAGLALHAADRPVDIRSVETPQGVIRPGSLSAVFGRAWRIAKESF